MAAAFFSLGAVVGSVAMAAPELTGKVFATSSDREAPLFTYTRDSENKDERVIVTTSMSDSSGRVAATERAEWKAGGDRLQLLSYELDQKQLGEKGQVEVKGDRVHFTFERGGKTRTDDEKVKGHVLVAPMIVAFLKKNWTRIQSGEPIEARLAVVDRLETVGFEYFKEKDAEVGGQKAVIVQMKPSSFIIAALVKPLRFYLTADGKRLLEVHGRTLVKKKEGQKWVDLDAVTVYETPADPSP